MGGLLPALVAACGAQPDTEVGIYRPTAEAAPGTGGAGAASGALVSGGAMSQGAGGAPVSGPPPREPYDPSVRFEWSETEPPEGACLPGIYDGLFQCELSSTGLFPSAPIRGPVTFELRESAEGEFLEITQGSLAGTVGFIVFGAELQGQLDCQTGTFDATTFNGVFTGGTFSGTLVGWLDRDTQTLQGAWSFAGTGWPPCVGLWNVRRLD